MRSYLLFPILLLSLSVKVAYCQQASRLISYYHYSGVPAASDWDSTNYYYSFGRAPFVYSAYNR